MLGQEDGVVMVRSSDLGFNLQDPTQQSNLFCLPQQRTVPFSWSLDAQLEFHNQEIKCILELQNERLKSAVQQQRSLEVAVMLRNIESKATSLMRQKEQVLAQSTNKRMELVAQLEIAEMESKSWQRLAMEKEAVMIDLINTLEQVKYTTGDAMSSCGSSSCDTQQQQKLKRIACKRCYSRRSCILFLPCGHLCSCKSCEALLTSCPVCESVKESGLEVFLV